MENKEIIIFDEASTLKRKGMGDVVIKIRKYLDRCYKINQKGSMIVMKIKSEEKVK